MDAPPPFMPTVPGARRRRFARRLNSLLTALALSAGTAGAAGYDLQFTGGVDVASGGTCALTLNSRCRFNNVVVGAGTGAYQRDVIVTVSKLTNATLATAFDNAAPVFSGTNTPAATATQLFAPTVLPTQNTANVTGWAEFTFDFVASGGALPAVGAGSATLPGTVWASSFDTDAAGTLQEFVEFVGGGITASDTSLWAGTTLTSAAAVDGGIQYQSGTAGQADITTDNTYKASAVYNNPSTFKLVYGARTGANGSAAGGRLTAFDFFRPDAVLLRPIVDGYKSVRLTTDADGSGSITAGDTLTYTLTYVNTGNTSATGFQIADSLPGNVTFTTGAQTVTAGTGSTASKNTAYTGSGTNNLLATGATLAANSTITVSIPVVVGAGAAGTTLSNQASASGTNIPATASDNVDATTAFPPSVTASAGWAAVAASSAAQTQVAAISATTAAVGVRADLSITKTDGVDSVWGGQTVTYTIVAKNNGAVAVSGAAVTDGVPAALTNVAWTCAASTGSSCAAASGGGGLNTTVNLLGGGTATFILRGTLSASASGTLDNTARVDAPAGVTDPDPSNNRATDSDTVTLSICAQRGGARGTNLLWSGGTFGSVPSGSSTTPPTVRNLASVATGTGIRTDYAFVNKAQVAAPGNYSPEDGEYNLSNSTGYRQDGAWHVVSDHTTADAGGQMMVINAGTNLGVFYQETVSVTPNTNYELSAWIINLIANNAATLPNFSIQLDRAGFDDDNNAATADGAEGQTVYASGDIPNTSAPVWRNPGYLFNSGSASQITIRFRNNNPGGGGNDLAIDDLSFTPCAGLPTGSISGTLYKDRNNSGVFEPGGPDTRLGANIAVSLTDAGSGVTVTVNTDAGGDYSFTNIPVGTYKIWVATVDPDLGGLTARAPGNAEYTGAALASGASLSGQNFGFNAPGLVLTKKVRDCGALLPAAACPTSAAFGTAGVGKPGETLEYCIDYTNPGALSAANVVLTDLVPGNTTADLGGYGGGKGLQQTVGATVTPLTSAADADAGELTASQLTLRVASLAAGASGQVCFRAKIK